MQEPEVQSGCDGHTLLSFWSPNFRNTHKSQGCSQFDIVPPGCRIKLPAHLRWIQKEGCNPHASSSPSYRPALERSQQSSPAIAQQGQSAAQPHCTLAGGEPRAVWDLPLYLLRSLQNIIHKTLQPLGTQGREGSIENTAQGRQQEHLLSDSQERGGEEEREVSYH